MRLRKSSFVHQIPVGAGGALLLHAVSQLRLKVDAEVDRLMVYFAQERDLPDAYAEISALIPYDEKALSACIKTLIERGFLTEKSVEEELADIAGKLGQTYGRDPAALLDRYRREAAEGSKPYWAVGNAQGLKELSGENKRLDVILFGDCDVHMEADFLRQEARARGYDLHVAATAPDDFAFAAEHKHDAIIVGALYARHFIVKDSGQEPHAMYIAQARDILRRLREKTSAPILIDNLPEPTVQPLGLAERGLSGHRARFRRANIALAEAVEEFSDAHVTDIAAALGEAGSIPLLDDWQVDFTHMGSPGWMLQRPESEKEAVYNLMPDMSGLARIVGGDPYRREGVCARAHIDTLVAVLGLGRKKCVIVDLDNTLWPGVLAETGAPFAWDPSISGAYSYIGLFFGLHEALLCLKKRGIVLACVSKNDDAVVQELWKYPEGYPRGRLLTLDDFVTRRINWNDKSENIRAIAEELGFALDAFLFVDDNPVERDRVSQRLPDVEVWGEDLFALRRLLLTDPRLQVPRLTEESATRTTLVKAQLDRQKFRAEVDENAYIASLQIQMRFEELKEDVKLDRIEELFRRTTQFNATGRLFSVPELKKLIANADTHVFILHVSDRFGDHGLVGAAVVEANEITGLVLSCRVLGMGVEHKFMQEILSALGAREITAKIVETSRNIPVRNIYRDHGFVVNEQGAWICSRHDA
ncbi:MAG: HAD-IIIC family phosphatase [Alphaproteobacteria bacterium]|nr:HAD-IIIC family phosphatase [Alphaproteobacteria bacterium]